jgi:hypothetical protein
VADKNGFDKCPRLSLIVANVFAKVFGQIFDSSIAEDYNCRRMFMDLLVLADSDGVVDMTPEAISRRTNVPINEVAKYLTELCQPDPLSRSKMHEGKRLVPLDSKREWGWHIVNYEHYRKIRDEEARRFYFRDAKRKQRRKDVKDGRVDTVDKSGQLLTPPSASPSSSKSSCTQKEAEDFCESLGLTRSDGEAMFLKWEEQGWAKIKDWKLVIRRWKISGYMPSQKNLSLIPRPSNKQKRINQLNERKSELMRLPADDTGNLIDRNAGRELQRINMELKDL